METIEQVNEDFNVKKPKKKGLLIGGIIAVALVIVVILIYFLVLTKPEFIFSKAIDKIFKVESEQYNSIKFDSKIKVSVEAEDESLQEQLAEIEKCTLKLGAQMDISEKKEIVDLGLEYDNEEVIDAQVYYNDGDMYAYFEGLFDKYIEIDMDEETKEQMNEIFESATSEENLKRSEKIVKIFRDELKAQIKEEGTFEQEKETIDIGDKEQKVTKSTLTLSEKQLLKVLSNVCSNLAENDEFVEFFEDDTFGEDLKELAELIEGTETNSKNKVEISIYTKGLNKVVAVDAEVYVEEEATTIIMLVAKEDENLYSYSVSGEMSGAKVDLLNGKVEIKKDKDSKKEQSGKAIITGEVFQTGNAKLEIDYSVKYNNGVDKIDIKNSVNINELTDADMEAVMEKLMERPLIGDLITGMNEGLYEDAKKASEETKKAMIKEQINMVKTELFLAYYEKEIELNEITEEKVKKTIEPYFEEADIKVVKTPGKLEFTITIDGIENKMNLEDFLNVGQGEIEDSTQEPISQNEVKDEYCGYSVTYSVPNGFKYDSEFSQNHYKTYSTSEMDANISLDGYTEAAYIQEINLSYEDYLNQTEYYRNVNLSTTKTINVGDKNFKYVVLSYEASLDNNGTIYYEKEQVAYIWYALDEKNMFKIEIKSFDKEITEEIIKGFLNISVKEI